MENDFDNFILNLGEKAKNSILKTVNSKKDICEIRFSVNTPLRIILSDNSVCVGKDIFSISDIRDIFSVLCEYSIHAYIDEIRKGFITSFGGYRIGICGSAVYENGHVVNIKDISSLNIRIPREIFGVSDKLLCFEKTGGILVIGPPCSGKTTILRDYARQISFNKQTVIVDERNEISGTVSGIPSFDVGYSYVMNGFSKSDGIETAVRAMAPEIIVCDEFGSDEDIENSMFAMKSGADIVASMHASDPEDFVKKTYAKLILDKNIFRYFIFMNRQRKIYKIMETGEFNI